MLLCALLTGDTFRASFVHIPGFYELVQPVVVLTAHNVVASSRPGLGYVGVVSVTYTLPPHARWVSPVGRLAVLFGFVVLVIVCSKLFGGSDTAIKQEAVVATAVSTPASVIEKKTN